MSSPARRAIWLAMVVAGYLGVFGASGVGATGAPRKPTACQREILRARPVHPRLLRGAPPARLTSILGVLRRPTAPRDVLPKGALPSSGYSTLWVSYVRLLGSLGGTRYFLIPGVAVDPLPAACRAALPPRTRRAEAQDDRQQRYGSVTVEPFDPSQGGNEGGVPWTNQRIIHGSMVLFPTSAAKSSTTATAYGIVPDGVAGVIVAGRFRHPVSVPVVGNFFVVRVPLHLAGSGAVRSAAFTVQWRAADGALIKTLSAKIQVRSVGGQLDRRRPDPEFDW
jgi:hypothetical protein